MNEKERYIVTKIQKYSKLKDKYLKIAVALGIFTTIAAIGLAKGVATHCCSSELHIGDIANTASFAATMLNLGLFSNNLGKYNVYKDEEKYSRQEFIETFNGRTR